MLTAGVHNKHKQKLNKFSKKKYCSKLCKNKLDINYSY